MNLFITATGTEIGKTFVTAGLIRACRRAGRPVRALKPVMSGYDPEKFADSDAAELLAALGEPVTPDAIAAISPFRFIAPLSPDIAAAREGRAIDFAALLETCHQPGPPLLVEGIGGVMVPLTDRHTVLDWMASLAWPVLLVAGSYLGTISHTLTAIAAIESRKLNITVLIINETPNSPPIAETIATLQRFAPGLRILSLPRSPGDNPEIFHNIARLIA